MEVVQLIEIVPYHLLAARFKEQDLDEFERLIENWSDNVYLRDFFHNNREKLDSGFFGKITVNEAVVKTKEEANRFLKELLGSPEDRTLSLDQLFEPLHKYSTSIVREESKAYGPSKKSWLRIYAIRITDNFYAISGGTIKLTRTLQETDDGEEVLQKLKALSIYLKTIGIKDADDYYGYFDIQ